MEVEDYKNAQVGRKVCYLIGVNAKVGLVGVVPLSGTTTKDYKRSQKVSRLSSFFKGMIRSLGVKSWIPEFNVGINT
jgi:hypothetical protein